MVTPSVWPWSLMVWSMVLRPTHTHTRLMALYLGLPRWSLWSHGNMALYKFCIVLWAGTRKVKPIWILLKQETVSGSGISWAICKSAPRSRQITMPAPHHSVFYRPDALPATQPTASKHWKQSKHWRQTVLRPTRHKIGRFRDVLPSQSLGSVLKKPKPNKTNNIKQSNLN